MSQYSLSFHPKAKKYLQKLEKKFAEQIHSKIKSLIVNCRPNDYRHMAGQPGFFRVTSGEYRVVYTCADGIVYIQTIGPKNGNKVYDVSRRRG